MSDDKFDAIVVGAGVAGTVAAYVMAKAGLAFRPGMIFLMRIL